MCGSAMPAVKSAAISPLDAPAANIASCMRHAVGQVAARAADLLGEGDAEQPELAGRGVQGTRHLARVLPLLEVGHDLAAHELRGGRPEGISLSTHSSPSSIDTCRDRTHSPSPLACGSNRVDAATPSPSRPWITTLTPPRLGSR